MTQEEAKEIIVEEQQKIALEIAQLRQQQLAEVARIEAEYEATRSAYNIEKRNDKIDKLLEDEG